MTTDTRFVILTSLLLAVVSGLGGLFIYIVKGAMQWSRTEQRLEELVADVKQLVTDKDRVHSDIMATIRDDRRATDRRLRWLEENLWKGKSGGQPHV